MTWLKRYFTVPRYEFTSCNQHGCRYKRKGSKRLSVANISCEVDSAADMEKLILLSDTLDVPVRYDFSDHTASIEVISREALKECI